ncbi:hypothetical protein NHQ30_003844 [Ciborinia camelliae]|nr:hypothetical protein NHQ30_003844 [Ciborinia camelliae]
MKFTGLALLACAAIANAAVLPAFQGKVNAVIEPATESHFTGVWSNGILQSKADLETNQALQKRDVSELSQLEESDILEAEHLEQKRAGAVAVVIGIAAVKGAAIITKIAIELGSQTLSNLGKWNDVREKFTQQTTLEMWNRNPNYGAWPAVVCYNKGYSLEVGTDIEEGKTGRGKTGWTKAKLSLGLLHTNSLTDTTDPAASSTNKLVI